MADVLDYLEKQSKPFLLTLGFSLILLLGIVDYLTGSEITFAVFYLLPVSLISWYISRQAGIASAFLCAVMWLVADLSIGMSLTYTLWNATTRLIFFLVVALLLATLRMTLKREQELARTDFLTQAANRRAFTELAQMEITRSLRYGHPITVMYVDVDNFKSINDSYGHSIGDALLCTISSTLKHHLRAVDVVARLGGDEFALLLPQTGPESAEIVSHNIQRKLLNEMQRNGWPVTFSIGVLTCINPPSTVGEMLKHADELMYAVKHEGKNNIKHQTLTVESVTENVARLAQRRDKLIPGT